MGHREPIFNAPGSVVAVLGVLVGVHVVRLFLPEADDYWLQIVLAFIPARLAGLASELPGGEIATYTSFVTHMLVHGDVVHLAFNGAWLLAFGGAVAPRLGGVRFLAFLTFTGICGAIMFLVFNFGAVTPMVGASGAVSGLMGGTMRFMFAAIDRGGFWALRSTPSAVPTMPLSEALRDRRVLAVTGLWLVLNLFAVLGFAGVTVEAGTIAWEAHVGGYLGGLLTLGLFEPRLSRHQTGGPLLH